MGGWDFYFIEVLLPFFGPPLIGGIIGHWVGGRALKGAIIGTLGGWAGIALYEICSWGYQVAAGAAAPDAANLISFFAFILGGSAFGGWIGARRPPVTATPLSQSSGQRTPADWQHPHCKNTAALKGHDERVNSVVIGPDGKTLTKGGQDQTIKLWDVAPAKEAEN